MAKKITIKKIDYMKKLIKIYIHFFFFIIHKIQAEIISKVEINGNERISDETIKIYGEIDLNKDYKKKDLDLMKNLYSTEFFEDKMLNYQITF